MINIHHLSLIFKLLNKPKEGLNFALSLYVCVDEFFIITDDATDGIEICIISEQIDFDL